MMKIKKSKLLEVFKQHNLNEGFLDKVMGTLNKLKSKVDSSKTKSKIDNLEKQLSDLEKDPSVKDIIDKYNLKSLD